MARWISLAVLLALASAAAVSPSEVRRGNYKFEVPDQCTDENGQVLPDSVVPEELTKKLSKKLQARFQAPKRVVGVNVEWPALDDQCQLPVRDISFHLIVRQNGLVCGTQLLGKLPRSCEPQVSRVIRTISFWQFEPATLDGKPTASHVYYDLHFKFQRPRQ